MAVKKPEVNRVQRIVIAGGGTIGWLAAAALARLLSPSFCQIRVIDTRQSAPGAFSEVALPSFHRLNHLLAIDEHDLIQKTGGTFRLGQRFTDWGALGDRCFHAFGSMGAKLEGVPFHHYWLKLRGMGEGADIEAYSTAATAAKLGRFARPLADRQSVLSLYSYGYHFPSASLAAYLREYAEAHAVIAIDRRILDVRLRSEDGFVDSLLLDDGVQIQADLYIDCLEAGSFLSQAAFSKGYEDWSQWLPCDRFLSVPSAGAGPIDMPPYSESTAETAGWRLRTPLQQGVDNGYAYSSRHLSDDEAAATLRAGIAGAPLSEARLVPIVAGRPSHFWINNCIALTGGGFEPLESTRLHLAQTSITRLVTLFPVIRYSPDDIEEYNRLTSMEHDRIRDFLILRYQSTRRTDSPFWDECRRLPIPETLRMKVDLWRRCGRIAMLDAEHFGEDSWIALLLGQHVDAHSYDPLADVLDVADVRTALSHLRTMIRAAVETLPTHGRYIEQHCLARSAPRFGEP